MEVHGHFYTRILAEKLFLQGLYSALIVPEFLYCLYFRICECKRPYFD